MNTSTTIKQRQYNPIQGERYEVNRWRFPSESRDRVSYTVNRDGTAYKCGCPARGLCKHITSAVLDDAKVKWDGVQVWTSQADAKRQKRRTVELTANGKTFWVTYILPRWIPREPGARLVSVTTDIHGNTDAWYAKSGRRWRRLVRRAA